MSAAVRSPDQVKVMRRAGAVVAEMHACIREAIRPGVTLLDLDGIGRTVLERRNATSNFLGYHGYPAVICASPNDVVVHGIPDDTVLEEGDIVSIDCGAIVDGWNGDAAFTQGVGQFDEDAQRLIGAANASLNAAITVMVDGKRLGDIGAAVQDVVENAGFSVVEDYTGHGIGEEMHEDPQVPNVGRAGKGPRLLVGNVLAIEPMLNLGESGTRLMDDGWTVRTEDGSRSAHVEHTIAITEDGPEILTLPL